MSTLDRQTFLDALHPTRCAICGTEGHADERWAGTFDADAFTPEIFSARRLPDRIHYRMVTCRACGLVRSDPVLDEALLADLYREASFDYGEELAGLKVTYGAALDRLKARIDEPRGLVDIGCGNGFVLDVALKQGWQDVHGVEPTADAIAKAPPGIGEKIIEDVMRPGLFEHGTLGGVTLFQVLDHINEPVELLEECRRVLRPGGAILAFNHNVAAVSARLLGDRSPIVDVEHTYLYSPDTMRKLFEKAGFKDIEVAPVRNTYSISYLMHLVPIPRSAKEKLLPKLRATRLGRFEMTVPLGNLCLTARPG